jgi:A/G-specific adenine glycosylase
VGWTSVTADASAPTGLCASDFAYGVLCSEIMLQQTQVSRVQTYFVNWMRKWPTLAALAEATEDEVVSSWAGLGYYRRARFLLQGARYAAAYTSGLLPTSPAALMRVPGIGPYTAASVASIAYGERVAAVDGNVVRVLSRLYAHLQAEPAKAAATREMQAAADALLDPARPGDWNQAVMELGATVCTPRAPRCGECPVAAWCRAVMLESECGLAVTDYPARTTKLLKRVERVAVRLVEWRVSDGQSLYLLIRRPANGLLAGLWEFPSAGSAENVSAETRHVALDNLLRLVGCPDACSGGAPDVELRTELGTVKHIFSHVHWTLEAQHARIIRATPPPKLSGGGDGDDGDTPEWRWIEAPAVGDLSSSSQKLFRLLDGQSRFNKKKRKPL